MTDTNLTTQGDWYSEGLRKLKDEMIDLVSEGNEPDQVVNYVYRFLSEIGIIDYDIEKEVIWERYFQEEDDE